MNDMTKDDDPHIKGFSERLYVLRQKKEQSARDMSLSLGMSHNYINGLELGRNYPAMRTFFDICEYLAVTPRDFFDYSNNDPYVKNELFEEIKKLDSEVQSHLLAIVKDLKKAHE